MSITIQLIYPLINFPVTDTNKTEYLIVRQSQHVANRFYITYMGNQASTFLFFV